MRRHLPRHLLALACGACACLTPALSAGVYSTPGGTAGSTAIALDDPALTRWATGVSSLTRGPAQIDDPTLGYATFGHPDYALGAATEDVYDVVSLGDGGSITLTFDAPISDGPGWDFAVFENGFQQLAGLYFCELAFVEVSSDGVNFFRFPAVSLTPTTSSETPPGDPQVSSFAGLDPTLLHNLAGRDPQGWGTPFDLAELASASPLLNISAITHLRLIDVIGNLAPAFASHDSLGNPINDPYPTPFAAGGFDLEALGVRGREATPPTLYQTWLARHFSSTDLANPDRSGRTADPDGDGLPNLLEYALGGEPLNGLSAPHPTPQLAPAAQAPATQAPALALTFTRIADPALTYTVESSADLSAGSWQALLISTGEANTAGLVTATAPETLTPTSPRRFLRLRVELP